MRPFSKQIWSNLDAPSVASNFHCRLVQMLFNALSKAFSASFRASLFSPFL